MTTSEYLINAALVAVVIRQLRGRRITPVQLLWPLALVGYFAVQYLRVVPTGGNDLVLVIAGVVSGLALGSASGLLTRILHVDDGGPVAKATVPAALLWVLGMSARMGFALYTQYGGGPEIVRFSVHHHISGSAWVDALVLMALVEVVARTAVLAWRTYGDEFRARLSDVTPSGIIRSL